MLSIDFQKRADDWPLRKRAKDLIRKAEETGFSEAMHFYALSAFGLDIWALDDGQLDDVEATFVSLVSYTFCNIQKRKVIN